MKVIDILDRIANGEELHFCIINKNFKPEYFYEKGKPLRYDDGDDVEWRISEEWLNCEIEIIEEDKKISKLDFVEENTFSKRQNGMTSEDRRLLDSNFRELGIKINEIIDKLNEGKE